MYVPVESRTLIEASVSTLACDLRYGWGQNVEDEMISKKPKQHLMDMIRHCPQSQRLGQRFTELHEHGGGRNWIPHIGPKYSLDSRLGVNINTWEREKTNEEYCFVPLYVPNSLYTTPPDCTRSCVLACLRCIFLQGTFRIGNYYRMLYGPCPTRRPSRHLRAKEWRAGSIEWVFVPSISDSFQAVASFLA